MYGHEHFVLPEAAIDENVATLPGLDGRKMSKSYGNTIPLFAPRAELKKLVFSLLTDSRAPGEPKEVEGSALFQLYQAFASVEQTAQMRQAFADGIAWGDAKQQLFERIDAEVAPMRERYEALMAQPAEIEAILRKGAQRLRKQYAMPFLTELRQAVGLRDLSRLPMENAKAAEKSVLPSFKQYRDSDGRFYFKLLGGGGELLVQSQGFDSPKQAGQLIAALKRSASADALQVAELDVRVPVQDAVAALLQLRDAEA